MSVETDKYIAAVGRMIRAAGRRVGDADEHELRALLELHAVLDEAIADAVAGQRQWGRSWAEISRGTGTTRQAAHHRWGRPDRVSA